MDPGTGARSLPCHRRLLIAIAVSSPMSHCDVLVTNMAVIGQYDPALTGLHP